MPGRAPAIVAGSVGLSLAVVASLALAQTTPEALGWLRRIYEATQKLSYTGTFVYQQGDRVETSRITRFVDVSGEVERLEVLDGEPREIVRTRESVRCYLPGSRVVKVDRPAAARNFPALLPEHLASLARYYTVSLGSTKRIAGFDSQVVVLTPQDELRYGHKLWADVKSGMLLKARAFDAAGVTVEQFTFTQLALGNVTRDKVKPSHAARSWRVEHSETSPASLQDSGWSVAAPLPGFRKIAELKRNLRESRPVRQVVFSDGLAAVSVFIEPLQGREAPQHPGLATLGAINIYTRAVANHVVTVVGEAPAASVRRIGDGVEFHSPRQ